MIQRRFPLLFAAFFVLAPLNLGAQPVAVTFDAGLVSISCQNAPLSAVFDMLEEVTGIELILEDAVKSTKLSADLTDVPLAMAVQRLLEGNGVNYAVMMDPRDWGRVDKVYVGAGGGAPARRAAPPPRRAPQPRPQPVEEDYDDYDDELDEFQDDLEEMDDEEMGDDQNAFPPPGSSPVPSYLPPQQNFPRSSFTPGAAPPQQQPLQPSGTNAPPPATFPFLDALGRPIPVPPNQQQRQNQQQN